MKRLPKTSQVPALEDAHVKRLGASDSGPQLGQWYWVSDDKEGEWFGCAVKIGSNYVEIRSPADSWTRVHLSNFWTECRHEPDSESVIHAEISTYRDTAAGLLEQVRELTQRLGMAMPSGGSEAASGALMVLSQAPDIKVYESALIKAKKEQFPALFEAIKEAHAHLATWMKATTLPMRAEVEKMKEGIESIDDRIFSISLYAGLTEQCVRVRKGKPAAIDAKLHVMQRMLFMDEESLLGYKQGGMEFKDIKAFDAFMSETENRDRILPHPRSLVAMRVRRHKKDRDWGGSLRTALINFHLADADKLTFLYIRNGEQVWRLSCEMDFGELIFPDRSLYDPLEPKMMKCWVNGSRVEFMSVADYEERVAADKETERQRKAWERKHPKRDWFHNPHRTWGSDLHEWAPLDHSNVHYDDGMAEIDKQIREYNRVALIIQGLYDRSLVLHPHHPVKSWTADGFENAIVLVNDGTNALLYGEPPDFEAYRASCNASLDVGSVTTGQDDFWQRREAAKENARRDRDYRHKTEYRPTHYKPDGNPGPGDPAHVVDMRAGCAVFKWERDSQTYLYSSRYTARESIPCRIEVPPTSLFNISAYRRGEFKRFFRDPRTRAQYLQWAPMLLRAEEYVAKHGEQPEAAARDVRTLWPFES